MNQNSGVYQDTLQAAIEQNISGSDFFFEIANEASVRYRCATKYQPIVHVRQDPNIKDCTGGIVWETAFFLATYLESLLLGDTENTCAKKWENVLEVGAGTGFLGLVLAHHGYNVIMTEAPQALKNLEANVSTAIEETHVWEGNRIPRAAQLRWESTDDRAQIAETTPAPFDLVVGTDVIFTVELVQPLLESIHALSDERTVVYLCFQERCPDAHKTLLELAPRYFEVFDDSELLSATGGCQFTQELECWLIRLTGRKGKRKTSRSLNQFDGPKGQKRKTQKKSSDHSNRPKKQSRD